jgi:hypothetical protein
MSSSSTTMSTIGSGLATYSRVSSVIGAIIISIIMIVLIILGVEEYRSTKSGSTNGTITIANCSPDTQNKGYSCNLTVTYTVDGKQYQHTDTIHGTQAYQVGQSINVDYDPSNPIDSNFLPLSTHDIAWIFFAIAIIIGILTFIHLYFVYKSPEYATITGGLGLAGNIRQIL